MLILLLNYNENDISQKNCQLSQKCSASFERNELKHTTEPSEPGWDQIHSMAPAVFTTKHLRHQSFARRYHQAVAGGSQLYGSG
jgi:hypothetical protein